MDFSAKLSLPYVLPNQAQKHVTMNESLRALDAITQLSVISLSESTPPEFPDEGVCYIPADGSNGGWDGADRKIASFQDGVWRIYTPQTGWLAWVEADNNFYVFDGESWEVPNQTSPPDRLGINATADAFNRLSLRSSASLFDNESGDHQLKINKANEPDTAGLVFQTGYTGHAEFGLIGNNNFNVKVSQDGQSFSNAILVRADNGNVGIGTYWPTAKLHVDGMLKLGSVTQANLPNPSDAGVGALIVVSDTADGIALAICDGSAWRRVSGDPNLPE